ncbi:hypothetical protein [Streptomyces rubiginosohelvolus]|uniref:hypothetical protein n=1 Tax=Streptomyces rubiginosohelvolus TaxID=67362 RepID=UPI0037188528
MAGSRGTHRDTVGAVLVIVPRGCSRCPCLSDDPAAIEKLLVAYTKAVEGSPACR